MKRTKTMAVILALALPGVLAVAHPHFDKTLTVKLPGGAEASISYNTTPANEIHASQAAVGGFVTPRRPWLKLSAEIKAGSVTVAAGEYTIGVIKNSDNDWTMALYPGKLVRGETPAANKVIRLESTYSSGAGTAEHMLIDITPGHGKFEGRAVLTLHFGTLFLAGALS